MAAALFCKRLWPRPSIYCSSLRHYGRRRKRKDFSMGSVSYSLSVSGLCSANCLRLQLVSGYDLGPPSMFRCHEYLKLLIKPPYGSPRVAKPFLARMLILGAIPTITTFSIIIKYYYCQYHRYHDVIDLVSKQMKASEVKASASFCKTLMFQACSCYQPYACHYLFQRLRSSYEGQLPLACYDAIFRKFCTRKRINDGTSLMVLLHEVSRMKQLGVYPDEKIYLLLLHARHIPLDSDNFGDDEKIDRALMMGSLMFTQGIRIGAVIPYTLYAEDNDNVEDDKKKSWSLLLRSLMFALSIRAGAINPYAEADLGVYGKLFG